MGKSYNGKNQLTSGSSYVYDGNGNPTTYAGTSLTFDEENKATAFGTALTADYTSDGTRAWKQNASSVRTYFLYDGITPVVELDSSGNVAATNTFGAAGLLSRRTASTGASVFYTFDERGNTVQRLSSSGTVLTSHISDAFGTTASSSATSDPYDGYGAQSGYYTDHETGLVLCTFRYFDPANGRWLTRDPIGYAGGINLYGYVTNNPVNKMDSLGLDHRGYPYNGEVVNNSHHTIFVVGETKPGDTNRALCAVPPGHTSPFDMDADEILVQGKWQHIEGPKGYGTLKGGTTIVVDGNGVPHPKAGSLIKPDHDIAKEAREARRDLISLETPKSLAAKKAKVPQSTLNKEFWWEANWWFEHHLYFGPKESPGPVLFPVGP